MFWFLIKFQEDKACTLHKVYTQINFNTSFQFIVVSINQLQLLKHCNLLSILKGCKYNKINIKIEDADTLVGNFEWQYM